MCNYNPYLRVLALWPEFVGHLRLQAMGSSKTLISCALLLAFASLAYCQDLNIIDITHEYTPAMPSYGSKKGLGEILTLVCDQRKGFKTTNSLLTIQVHSGTHTDAPSHAFIDYYNQGIDATTLSLQTLNGDFIIFDFFIFILICLYYCLTGDLFADV